MSDSEKTTVKRGRGRPAAADTGAAKEAVKRPAPASPAKKVAKDNGDAVPAKRGRGRPPKKSGKGGGKGRGRPPKAAAKNDKEDESEGEDE